MNERTSPSDALERLAWHLNYHAGETVSLNRLSKTTDLSWATVQKYTQLLEALDRITPRVSVTSEGIEVRDRGRNLSRISSMKDIELAIYILIHAEINGGPTEPLSVDDHSEVLEHYGDTIKQLDDIGWIEHNNGEIRLTPQGIAIAGPARSELRNQDASAKENQIVLQRSRIVSFAEEADRVTGAKRSTNSGYPTDSITRPDPSRTEDDYKPDTYRTESKTVCGD